MGTSLILAFLIPMYLTPLLARFKKLSVISCYLIGTTVVSLPAYADDTEIFFSSARGGTLSKSNILFVLDNSGSMGYNYEDVWAWGEDFSTSTIEPNRMDDLQDTMVDLLQDIKNVNIGIMRFTYDDCPTSPPLPGCDTRDNYAKLIHPVADIDAGNNRTSLQESIRSLLPRTNTPITASLYEAAMVMRGGPRGREGGNYISPILSECQQNHIVILSDGIANSIVPQAQIEALPGMGAGSCGVGSATGTFCGLELAKWLHDTDHRPGGDVNNIKVHTIGFAINSPFLQNLADVGGGGYRAPNNAQELSIVFQEVLKEVKDVDTTFVNPVTSTDRLNRLGKSDDIYFGMFTPSLKPQWDGNLKRYKLGIDNLGNIVIKDAANQNAISDATGYFADGSRSIWSDNIDGPDVTKGGAASKISHPTRKMYTYVGSDLRPRTAVGAVNLATGPNFTTLIDQANPLLTASLLGVGSQTERDTLISWARGSDTDGLYDDPSDATDSRKHIGDILHSTPITIDYDHANGPLIFFGTNEGFLHAIDSANGEEEYSFIPRELLGNLRLFRENSRDTPHPYGLDGPITFHHIDDANANESDKDGNGIVDAGEIAMIYFGMRRGGRSYYGMDVSSRSQPKLSWHIQGGIPGDDFEHLAQTWSKPITARIRYKGSVRYVLIFGGGYDENQDASNTNNLTQTQSPDTMGNAIYIVDAGDGSLIWKADRNSHSDMDFSIPSDINVLDIDNDGLADRLYVGDMGGQLWRFDINASHKTSDNANTLVYGGVMAKLGGNNTVENARRFYNKPDVALISKEGEHFMSVSIGSGWRAHPRNTSVKDRFYMIRDNRPLLKIMNSNDFGAVAVPGSDSWRPATEADLRDITLNIDESPIPDQEGWMLRYNDAPGEKSLASSLTINNQLVFTTYTPEVQNDECLPAADSTTLYAVDVLRGNPVLPLAGGDTSTIGDRKETIALNGIAPPPTAIIKKTGSGDGSYAGGVLIGSRPVLQGLDFSGLTVRTFWHDKLRGSAEPEEVEPQTCSGVADIGGVGITDSRAGGADENCE